jgi:hypothetical protein
MASLLLVKVELKNLFSSILEIRTKGEYIPQDDAQMHELRVTESFKKIFKIKLSELDLVPVNANSTTKKENSNFLLRKSCGICTKHELNHNFIEVGTNHELLYIINLLLGMPATLTLT